MRVSPKLLIFEILAFLVFAVLAGAGFLAWRLSQGPIDLELLRPQVERSLSEARGGQPVKIQNLVLEWVADRGKVEAAARGFTALDAKGAVMFQAQRATIALDAGSLLSGKFHTRQMRLENGTATVLRSKDGVWSLANIVLLKEPASDKPFDPLKDINWTTLATPIRALISAGSFERVELANFRFNVIDQKSGTNWTANPVGGVWTATKDGVALNLDVKLAGAAADQPNRIAISLASDGAVTHATGKLALEGVDPTLVAKMFGYAGDGFASSKPANATFAMEATEKGGLQSTKLSLSDVTGHATYNGQEIAVANLAFDAAYDPATKIATLQSLNIASDRLTGQFTGTADLSAFMAGDATKPTPVKLTGKNAIVGFTPTFQTPWPLASVDVEGTVATDLQRFSITNFRAETGALTVAGSGEVYFDGPPEARKIGVKASVVGTGFATPQQVIQFWPVKLGEGARQWVHEHILDGKANKLVFNVDWTPGANEKGFLPNEKLSLDFNVEGAAVKFLDDYPPVTGVAGVGHLKGNSLTIDATAGTLAGWQLDEGKVILPQFAPHGAMMDITVSGRGDLTPMMKVLDQSNLHVGSRYGLVVDQMTGVGGAELHFQREMGEDPANEHILYQIKGGFRGASAPNIALGFGLSDSDVTFEVNQDGIAVAGAGNFGPAPVVFDWKEGQDKTGKVSSDLTAKARVTPDLLNAYGVAARNMMQGEAAMELKASGSGGRDFNTITANLDFGHAQLDLAEFGWRKKYDAPAQGVFRYGKDDKGGLWTGDIRGDGLELTGSARMDQAGGFQSADIERIFSRESVDLHGGVAREPDGGYKVALAGAFFDATPWMDTILNMSGGKDGEDAAAGGEHPGDPGPLLEVQLNADRLRLRENAEMTEAKVAFAMDNTGPRNATVTGAVGKGKKVDVAITGESDVRNVSIKSDDAGFAAKVLLKLDYLVGGKMTLNGKFAKGNGNADVTITDVRLMNAPLVAKLLSIASLRGLADTLNGDGVLFTEIKSPLHLQDGRIDLPGLRASGPAMGITARGWIAPQDNELSLDGVLVPSFGVNSLLGGIPIIGDLFVSRQGEGMFAPTYSVRGTFSKAQVMINPVAALTPGVLRRIFENPSEPPPADAAATPETPVAQNAPRLQAKGQKKPN
ncbi:MAG TPA: DUF3971 domain-containing protein [Hyphomonadaceae bacterium]|nr:DUF3971 domain-containing protein [Hyphomonadaceae bacterium]